MARKPRVDLEELNEMLKEGKTPSECAEHFNVSLPAISQAKGKLGLANTKCVTLEKASKVIDKNLDTISQLNRINKDALEILDVLMAWQRGDGEAIRCLETQVKKLIYHDKKTGKDVELGVQEIKFKDPRELALKAMAEIRGQLRLQMDIYQMLYDVQAAQEFQKEVLEAIGEAAPDVRERIINNLNQKRAIRSAIQITG